MKHSGFIPHLLLRYFTHLIQNAPFSGRYRVGALHIANCDELQIWFVGQVEYMSAMEQQPLFTPMLRFFIGLFYGKLVFH